MNGPSSSACTVALKQPDVLLNILVGMGTVHLGQAGQVSRAWRRAHDNKQLWANTPESKLYMRPVGQRHDPRRWLQGCISRERALKNLSETPLVYGTHGGLSSVMSMAASPGGELFTGHTDHGIRRY